MSIWKFGTDITENFKGLILYVLFKVLNCEWSLDRINYNIVNNGWNIHWCSFLVWYRWTSEINCLDSRRYTCNPSSPHNWWTVKAWFSPNIKDLPKYLKDYCLLWRDSIPHSKHKREEASKYMAKKVADKYTYLFSSRQPLNFDLINNSISFQLAILQRLKSINNFILMHSFINWWVIVVNWNCLSRYQSFFNISLLC